MFRAKCLENEWLIPSSQGRLVNRWRLESWDGFLVPNPLSTVEVEYLPPRFVPREATRADLESMALEIGTALSTRTRELSGAHAQPLTGR